MNANRKVILIILLGAAACLLSFFLSQYVARKNDENQWLLTRVQQLSSRVEYIRLLSRTFIQNGDDAVWRKTIENLDQIRVDPGWASDADHPWQSDLASLNRRLIEYRDILNRIHDPAVQLNSKKERLQGIGLSFSTMVAERVINPSRKEEGLRIYMGDPIDPFKSRIKETAYDLIGLHLQQQIILLELIQNWDLPAYQAKKQTLSKDLERQTAQLRYLNILMGKDPSTQSIIGAINERLTALVLLEKVIIGHFSTLVELNRQLTDAGDRLLETSETLAVTIVSDTLRANRLNRILNWVLLITILSGLALLGALLAGDIIRFVGELKASRDGLRDSERRLRDITANIPGVVFQFESTDDQGYRSTFVSENAHALFGLRADSPTFADDFQAHLPVDEKAQFLSTLLAAIDRMAPWTHEGRFIKSNGEQIWFSGHAVPHRAGDRIVGYGVLMDISRRKRLEESLRLTQFCFEKASIGILRIGEAGEILNANDQACRSLGYSSAELCRMTVFDIDPNFNPRIWPDHVNQLRKVKSRSIESVHRNKRGDLFPVQILINIMIFENQEFHVAFVQDITERKQWENEREASERRYRKLFNEAPVMYVITEDRNGAPFIVDVNNLFLETLGYAYPEVIGKPLARYYTAESCDLLFERGGYERALKGQFMAEERDMVTRDGDVVNTLLHALPEMKADGRVVGTRAMFLDITARKKVELEAKRLAAALARSQKMEALGTLSGGIAHDFNNILSAVVGYTQLSLGLVGKTSQLHHNLQQILAAAMRASDLVRQILSFSRQTKQELTPLQVGPIVKEALKLLRSTLPATIDIIQDIGPGTGHILADPTQIHQIVMNLCTNAAQAMETGGGRMIVGVAQNHLSAGALNQCPGLVEGDYVRLTVKDSGDGIPLEIRERIFDPYFTTKASGKGTGLGLSVVHGIVQSYGGCITVASPPHQGTTFEIYFPVVKELPQRTPEQKLRLPTGTETILLVDDEPTLVEIGQQSLQALGYSVRAYTDSQEALRRFEEAPHEIDLLISDLTMPKMTGDALAARMRTIRPDLPVILCTGFSSRFSDREAADQGINALVDKPVALERLAGLVRVVLDGGPPASGRPDRADRSA